MFHAASSPQSKKPIGVDLAGAEIEEKLLFEICQEAEKQGLLLQYYSTKPFSSSCKVSAQVIEMDDSPFSFRKKKDSSLLHALHDLANGSISALVTCANTGAAVAAASIYLGRFISLKHPALAATISLPAGKVVVLDIGAFVTAQASNLVSYARVGASLASLQNISSPRVGILNIGKEQRKGTATLHKANMLLQEKKSFFSYIGFVEPIDVFSGEVDVLVTNGFIGNIFLKTVECATTLGSEIPQSYGGALLVGVKHPLIKCHGNPTMTSFTRALFQARDLVVSDLVRRLENAYSTKGI